MQREISRKCIARKIGITQDFAQQSTANVLAEVTRYGHGSSISVLKSDMAPRLALHLEARSF